MTYELICRLQMVSLTRIHVFGSELCEEVDIWTAPPACRIIHLLTNNDENLLAPMTGILFAYQDSFVLLIRVFCPPFTNSCIHLRALN